MDSPYVSELVRRLQEDWTEVTVRVSARGDATIVCYSASRDTPLVLQVREADLAAAVTAIGTDCRDALWPGSTIEAAGFNVLLTHLHELLVTRDTTEPLRITARGLQWPDRLRLDE
jgi:hypothetical protein